MNRLALAELEKAALDSREEYARETRRLRLQGKYEKALVAFRDEVVKELNDHVDAAVVYGSVARGEAGEDSDIDVLIISSEKEKITNRVFDISYDVDLEYGVAMPLALMSGNSLSSLTNLRGQ